MTTQPHITSPLHSRRRRTGLSGPGQTAVAILLILVPFVIILQGVWLGQSKDRFAPFLVQFQLERVQCEHCGGRGVIRDNNFPDRVTLCPVCFGIGGHQYRKLDKRDALCPACGGMGRVMDSGSGTGRVCMRCGGRGLIRVEP
ncbi:MAG: hypothetical protein V1873_07700 [Verrucomicrobiota bacterium]